MLRSTALFALVLPLLAGSSAAPTLRLPATVKPLHYALKLELVPEKETFGGVADIEVQVLAATDVLWLNASGLNVQEAVFTPKGGVAMPAMARQEGGDFLGLALGSLVQPGRGLIRIRYTGLLSRTETQGLFTQEDRGHWYAFSQFESTSARQAFPCFDEPAFKTPFQVILRVPKGDLALSNTPVASQHVDADGLKTVRFATTRPLPTYLVALGVGPFEVVEAGRAGRKGTPIRIVVPQGHKADAAFAAGVIPGLFAHLEAYFGVPYPYEKLDHLVAIQMSGAMENAGLIIHGPQWLLAGPAGLTVDFKRTCANYATHEMAHQWFGDLVTMAWWNDLWLSEAFATWVAKKEVKAWQPTLDGAVEHGDLDREWGMRADALPRARMIRQPILRKDDIDDAFDGITYSKGAAVLGMFEAFLGPARFRQGVTAYLKGHAYGTGTSRDFLAALAKAAPGRPGEPAIPEAFTTFLDQPGLPLVTVALAADGTGASVLLDQRRLLPPGVDTPATPTWKTPVTLRYAVKGRTFHQRLWLTSAHTVCRLPVAARSLDYLTVNDGMAGYYRVLYRGDLLARLLRCRTRLTGEERLGLLQDLAAVAKAGAVPEAELLLLVADLAGDPDPRVVAVAANLAEGLDGYLVPDGSRANYVRFLQDRFGRKARSLGFFPRAGENDDTRVLRKALLGLVALGGEDTGLRSTARELALKWLGKEQTLDPTLVDVVLKIAARTGDRDLYDRFKAAARAAQDHGEQQRLLLAMASFDDPGVEKAALAELLADDFDPRQTFEMLQPGARKPATRALVLAFVQDHFEAIVARLPRSFAAKLPLEVGSALADAKDREDLKACFQERIAPFPAGTLNLDKVLETITLAEAEKLNQQASAAAFLETWVAPR